MLPSIGPGGFMIPVLLERVTIRGEDAVFLAFRIDADQRTADLVPLGTEGPVRRGVSFDMLEAEEHAVESGSAESDRE